MKQPTPMALWIVFALMHMMAVIISGQSDTGYALSDNWSTFQGAQTVCQMLYGNSSTLAGYTTDQDRQAVQSLCTNIGCWVDGQPTTDSLGRVLCPYYYQAPGSDPPATAASTFCATYQKFVCTVATSATQPSSSPMPSPVPSPMPSPVPSPMPSPVPSSMPSPVPSPMPSPVPSPQPSSTPSPIPSPTPSPSSPSPPPLASSPRPPQPPPPKVASPQLPSPSPVPSPDYSGGSSESNPDYISYSPVGTPSFGGAPDLNTSSANLESAYDLLDQLSMVVAVHLVHIPGTDKYLYMERPSGYHPDNSHEIAGSFDVNTREWIHLETPDGLFCCGHTLMSNGSVAILGGHVANAGFPAGIQSIRTYTNGSDSLYKVTEMRYPRWYPTITLLPNGKIMAMGGTQGVGAGTAGNPYYEIWDPQVPLTTQQFLVDPTYLKSVRQNYYPMNYILPTGDMFNWCNRIGWILDPYTGTYKVPLPTRPTSIESPTSVYYTQYPYTGSSVMLTLKPETNYTVEVMVFGGADANTNKNLSIPSCSESMRLKVSMPGQVTNDYYFNDGWVQEFMGSPRVMPDSVLLPNGMVILLNGAQAGLAGDAASGGGSKSSYPNFFAEMYNPDAALGNRWTSLARSQIARLYHSTAALTTNGTILVTGCDRCSKIITNLPFSPPQHKAEYRNELFYPPFWYDFANKPLILSSPSNITYGQTFTVTYTAEMSNMTGRVTADTAVLVAPSSCTHSFNTNQRIVKLVIKQTSPGKLQLVAPPNINIAPPQMYMLFLLNGQTYGKSAWVMLSP